ncbi:22460_t:CDS:1, partial [Cetraspora pellucida]
ENPHISKRQGQVDSKVAGIDSNFDVCYIKVKFLGEDGLYNKEE